jgi:hypothetical protein
VVSVCITDLTMVGPCRVQFAILLMTLFRVRDGLPNLILISDLSSPTRWGEWGLSLWISVGPDGPHIFIQSNIARFPFIHKPNFLFVLAHPTYPHRIYNFTLAECIATSPRQRTDAVGLNTRRCRSFSLPPPPRVMALVFRHK